MFLGGFGGFWGPQPLCAPAQHGPERRLGGTRRRALARIGQINDPIVYLHTTCCWQNLLLMRDVTQTLAGRTGVLHLLPLSRVELEGGDQPEPQTPDDVFGNQTTSLDRWATVHTGFYPRIRHRHIPPSIWLADYVQTYLRSRLVRANRRRVQPPAPDAAGILHSRTFPGLRMASSALLAGDFATVLSELSKGIDTSEHAGFIAKLRTAGSR